MILNPMRLCRFEKRYWDFDAFENFCCGVLFIVFSRHVRAIIVFFLNKVCKLEPFSLQNLDSVAHLNKINLQKATVSWQIACKFIISQPILLQSLGRLHVNSQLEMVCSRIVRAVKPHFVFHY